MNKSIKNRKEKKFASSIAISFFFASIFIVIFYFVIDDKVSPYVSLINTTAVRNTSNGTNTPGESSGTSTTKYNFEAKRLINYPKWGKKYATLNIPSIKLKLPVYHGDSLKILRYGVGHYAGSYFPGENGTVIFAAHNNVGYFHELDKVKVGDIVTVETTYGTFNYQVDSTKIVHESNLDAFPINHERELLIMYTCWPINRRIVGRKTQRYVVYAKKIGDINE